MAKSKYPGDAEISDCGDYRYRLRREVSPFGAGQCLFIMLNPSTADGDQDDPTIRRCIGFTERLGFASMSVVNLFAYRATDPAAMKIASAPVGPANNGWIMSEALHSKWIICAWGTHGGFMDRDLEVWRMLRDLGHQTYCLGETKGFFPVHPLYQPRDAIPQTYMGRPQPQKGN